MSAADGAAAVWLAVGDCRIGDLLRLVARRTDPADYPFAAGILQKVPVYEGAAVRRAAADPDHRRRLLGEWVAAMTDGPGLVAIRGAFADRDVLDAATAHYHALIAEERAAGAAGGDHFAKPGANDRVWNALEKLAARDPELFAGYYGNPVVALVSEAWLGPGYQVTAQINCVNPGGAAQTPHRDYHLGFPSPAPIERYPAHVHRLSPVLTLQGAVAHCDMPLESGPTLYLPYSQAWLPGYLAMGLPALADCFAEHHAQLPLARGDAVFFNPALFHAAGHNRTTDVRRMANLLQVSSAYGRPMETIDRARLSTLLYPALQRLLAEGRITALEADNAIAAAADGYAFPTNLDRDPPLGGLAPETQQGLFRRALAAGWAPAAFAAAVADQAARRQA